MHPEKRCGRTGAALQPMRKTPFVFLLLVLLIAALPLLANTAPIVDSFVATPAVPAPGQTVALKITAHDPDCVVSPCTSGCGLTIRSDLLSWSDNTGRTGAFQGSTPAPSGSPWSATVTWIAPSTEGNYQVTAQIADSGTWMCGNRMTATAVLNINVSNSRPPVIDSISASPTAVPVGGQVAVTVAAHDDLGRQLSYAFSADAGTIAPATPASSTATWTAPQIAGNFTIRCAVTAAGGATVSTQTSVAVQIGTYLRTAAPAGLHLTRAAGLPDTRIAAVDGTSGALIVMTSDGQLVWRVNGLSAPVGVAVAGSEIFVVERGASRVSVWSTTGSKLRAFALSAVMPNGVAAGPNPGELSITDTASALIDVVSTIDGRRLRSLGNGKLLAPSGVATANGRTAVADTGLNRIFVFDSAGALTGTYGDDVLLVRPQGLAWDAASHRFIVADSFSAEISIIGEEGVVRGSLAGFGSAPGQLVNPIDVALIPGGLIAVTTASGAVPMYQLLNTLGPLAPATGVQAADRPGDEGGAIAVSWTISPDDPARVIAYRIERSQAGAPFVAVGRTDAGTSSFVDATTTDGICYTYHVVATDGTVEATSTDTPCAVSRDDLPPPVPASAAANPVSPWVIGVSWAAVAAPDLAGYAVDVTNAAGALVKSVTVAPTSTTVNVDGLTPDTPYTLGVRAFDFAKNSSLPRSTAASTYPDIPPPVPSAVTATDLVTGGNVKIAWTTATSRVPVTKYHIAATPATAGWPSASLDTDASPGTLGGLVNKLAYGITVTSFTPWGRASDPSTSVSVTPTAPVRDLPVVAAVGWDGTTGMQDTAGLTVQADLEGEARILKFEYRTSNAQLQLLLDGGNAGPLLSDTAGSWKEASLAIDLDKKNPASTHLLEFRNTRFPDPLAQLAVRNMDLVPLVPKNLQLEPFNSVLDLVWVPRTKRADVAAELTRTSVDKKTAPVAVPCPHPTLGRCRDPFHDNVENFSYTLTMVSPAGWRSDSLGANGHAKYDDLPPAVTDLWIDPAKDAGGAPAWQLSWTPISTAPAQNTAPVAIALYRVYRVEFGQSTPVAETSAPPLMIPTAAYDPAKQTLLVRSVDAQGKESR